jgi:hypothetical protein
MEWWQSLKDWFLALGAKYGVDPVIFGSIYVGGIPLFTLSLWWLIRSIRQHKPVVLPVLSTGFFFLSAYLYLIVVGRNIPWWVYGLIAALVAYGVYATWQKIKKGTSRPAETDG